MNLLVSFPRLLGKAGKGVLVHYDPSPPFEAIIEPYPATPICALT